MSCHVLLICMFVLELAAEVRPLERLIVPLILNSGFK